MSVDHVLTVKISDEGYTEFSIECNAKGTCRNVWEATDSCICECTACVDGDHDDCSSTWVEDIGHQWCQAQPTEDCWYQHAVAELGGEMLTIVTPLTASWAVELSGAGWDDPITVTEALQDPVLSPSERIALTVAFAQAREGRLTSSPVAAAVCIAALARVTGYESGWDEPIIVTEVQP